MNGPISISVALGWRKTLLERHAELIKLRSENANLETRYYGANVDKERVVEPLYDVVSLDNTISRIALEIRKLDEAVKATNQATTVADYERTEAVLGELVAAKKSAKKS